jgi:large exoprotein involved in heme utilization and adhesion
LQVSEGGALLTGSGLGPGSVGTGDSGDLIIRATDSVVLSNGQLLSATYRQGNAGNIKIATPKFTLDSDGIVANITSGAGDAGSINVESERVSLTQGAKISSGTFSTGRGGDVTITASDSVFISGHSNSDPQSRTGVGSQTAGGGDAGDLQISTPEFNMDGGAISSGTIKGSGNAGNIEISVERANLTGGAIITGSTLQGSSGHGGTITFTASKSITIAGSSPDGSPNLITSLTIGSGNAGRIFLSTPELTMSQGEITTFAFDTSTGHAGDIELQVGRATLTGTGQPLGSSQFLDQASINSTSRNTEQGGTIKITASDSVVLSGPGVEILSEADGGGESGTIDLHAKDIQLTDGATISSKNTATRDGGNVTITATETFRSDNGRVTTTAANANGGNITIGAGALAHISRSEISAAVRSEQGKGGNITIEPTSTVLNRSTITANAFGGPGGNVRITSDVFLASPDSSVTASSALGVDGLVDIQSPITSISGSFAPLPETFVNVSELLPVRCAARLRDGQASSFVVRGRDALPTSPDGVLPSPILRRDKTNTVGSNAASVTGWGDASVSQASVEVDCWR